MNIGFLGCSKIGEKVIEALNTIPDVTLYGCSARNKDKALAYQKSMVFLSLTIHMKICAKMKILT